MIFMYSNSTFYYIYLELVNKFSVVLVVFVFCMNIVLALGNIVANKLCIMFSLSTTYFSMQPCNHTTLLNWLITMLNCHTDMRKGADTRKLSAEVLADCKNIKPDTVIFV